MAHAPDQASSVGVHGSGQSGGAVHEIQWSDALPWWILFRAAGACFAPTVIFLAALGGVATWAGWSLADRLGVEHPSAVVSARAAAVPTALPGSPVPHDAMQPDLVLPNGVIGPSDVGSSLAPSRRVVPRFGGLLDRLPRVAADVLRLVAVPFRPSATLGQMAAALVRLGWFVLVWSIFGTAITRHVALKLVGEDAPGFTGSLFFGSLKWLSAFNAVAFVLLGIAALSVPGALLGLVMRVDWGLAVAGAVWPLMLAGGVVLSILTIGLVAGWPLMVAAVGVERGDSFQSISTAFSYLYQRPLHYAFYAAVALVVAVPAIAAAGLFADATGTLAMWAASFGMGHERTAAVLGSVASGGASAPAGARLIGFWMRGLEALLSSFGWGYFWAIATAAYLLLRRDVDGTEFDEVVLDEPAGAA